MTQVSLLDPVTQTAASAGAGIANNLLAEAELSARAGQAQAQIDAQKEMASAQIKSQEKMAEGVQQGFDKQRGAQAAGQDKEIAAQNAMAEKQMAFQAEQQRIDNENDQKRIDRLNNLELKKSKIGLMQLKGMGEENAKLTAARQVIAGKIAQDRSDLEVANGVIGRKEKELESAVENVKFKGTDMAAALGNSRQTSGAVVRDAVAEVVFAVNQDLGNSNLGDLSDPKKAYDSAAKVVRTKLPTAVASSLVYTAGLDPSLRGDVEELIKLSVADHGERSPEIEKRDIARFKELFGNINATDPTMAHTVYWTIKGLSGESERAAQDMAQKDLPQMRKGPDDAGFGIADVFSSMGATFTGSKNVGLAEQMLEGMKSTTAKTGAMLDAAGVSVLDERVLALSIKKAVDYVYATGDAEGATAGLPPAVADLVNKFIEEDDLANKKFMASAAVDKRGAITGRLAGYERENVTLDAQAGTGGVPDDIMAYIDSLLVQ